MTVDTTRVEDLGVRWTPAEVYSIQAAGLRDLAEEYARQATTIGRISWRSSQPVPGRGWL